MPQVHRTRRPAARTRSTSRGVLKAPLVSSLGLAIVVIVMCALMFVAWLLGLSPIP